MAGGRGTDFFGQAYWVINANFIGQLIFGKFIF